MKVHVVDLKSETIASPISVRAYLNQTITEFKQLIAQVSCSSQFLPCIFSSLCTLPVRSVLQTQAFYVCFLSGYRAICRNHARGPGALL